MKKNVSYLFIFIAALVLSSCNNNGFKKTKSGLLYKIISDGKGPTAKKGQFIKFTYVQKVRDSVLVTTANAPIPMYTPVDSVGPIYSPLEVFTLLRKGDSLVVVQLADSIESKYHQPLPPFIKKRDKLTLTLRVLDVFTTNESLNADRQKSIDAEKDKEIALLQNYFKQNNITDAQKTDKGDFYQILTHGSGPKVDSGKQVSINYSGSDMQGRYFDSNVDSTKQAQRHPLQPFSFVAGVRGAVPGMVEAITNFKKGDKGKLFIPGMMGYGQQGAGGVIKPFENLIFDIEVVDVAEAPKQPARQMPQLKLNNKGQVQLPTQKSK